jgi:hypothetical protein
MASKSKNKALKNPTKNINNKENPIDGVLPKPTGLKKAIFYALLI